MTSDAIARLRRHRELGVRILIDFIQATPETAAGIVERERAWMRELIPLVEPFGDGVAARFEPLTPMHPHEQSTVARCAPLDDWSNLVRVCHAVRMFRLDELFQRFEPVPPKGKGGNRRTYNDEAIVGKARVILESSGAENKMAAAREAMTRFPELVQGYGSEPSKAKRIARQI